MILLTDANNSELIFECHIIGVMCVICITVMLIILIKMTKPNDLRTMTLRYFCIGFSILILIMGIIVIGALISNMT